MHIAVEEFIVLKGGYVRHNGVRLNIICFRCHVNEQTVHESMRVLLYVVRTAPLTCFDTCRLHLVLETFCGQQHAIIY